MHFPDIAIPAALVISLILGLIAGIRLSPPRLATVRATVVAAVIAFAVTMIIAALATRQGASESNAPVRIAIFWIAAACMLPPAFGLVPDALRFVAPPCDGAV